MGERSKRQNGVFMASGCLEDQLHRRNGKGSLKLANSGEETARGPL